MPSKISGINGNQVPQAGAGRAVQRPQDAASGGASNPQSAAAEATQDVQITGTARQLVDLDQKLRDLPIVNEPRVKQIRQSLEKGTYSVRPRHVADQLLSMDRALRKLPEKGEPDGSSDSGQSEQ